MSKKMIWGLAAFIILIITATVWKVLHDRAYIKQLENDLVGKQEIKEDRDKPTEQVNKKDLDTSHPDFHVHEDGTPHIGTHEDPKEQYTAPEGAVLKPDFPKVDPNDDPVKAAYKRLEYIKNNPYAWGGVHSERATALISELMPPRESTATSFEEQHDQMEVDIALLTELIETGDPRAAEVLATYTGEGIQGGNTPNKALAKMGPPAVPYLLPYLDPPYDISVKHPGAAAFALGRIGTQHREELEGVIQHIIIPKLEAFIKSDAPLMSLSQTYAYESLEMLKNNEGKQ